GAALQAVVAGPRGSGRRTATALRRGDPRQATPADYVAGQGEPLPRRARGGGRRSTEAPASGGAERPDLPGAEALARTESQGRRDPGVRRLPQLDTGGDRRAEADHDLRAR